MFVNVENTELCVILQLFFEKRALKFFTTKKFSLKFLSLSKSFTVKLSNKNLPIFVARFLFSNSTDLFKLKLETAIISQLSKLPDLTSYCRLLCNG